MKKSATKKPSGNANAATDKEAKCPFTNIGAGGELHQKAMGDDDVMTTQQGVPISDDQNSLKAGARGQSLEREVGDQAETRNSFPINAAAIDYPIMFISHPVPDAFLRILILGPVSLLWIAAVVRLIGLRSFSKMTAFDFVTTVATGSLLGAAATARDWLGFIVPSGAMLALLGTQAIIAEMRIHSIRWLKIIENEPLLLMREGLMDKPAMKKARVTEDDLLAKLREANVLKLSEVRAVALETTGDISVLHGEELDESLLESVRRSG